MEDFEMRIQTCKGRSRVKAARDLGDVIEGLRIVVREPWTGSNMAGTYLASTDGYQIESLLYRSICANSGQCDHQHASSPGIGHHEVQASIFVLAAPSAERSTGTPALLHWSSANLLRNWLS